MGDFEAYNVKYPVVLTPIRQKVLMSYGFKFFNSIKKYNEYAENMNEDELLVCIDRQGRISHIAVMATNVMWKIDFKKDMARVGIPIKRLHTDF